MAEVAQAKVELEQSAARLEQIQPEMQALLLAVPNLPHESVPKGTTRPATSKCAAGARRAPSISRSGPRRHRRAARLDFATGVKLSGARFTVMKQQVARLHRALAQFMLDVQTASMATPSATRPTSNNEATLRGTGQLPKFEATCSPSARGDRKDWPRKTSTRCT